MEEAIYIKKQQDLYKILEKQAKELGLDFDIHVDYWGSDGACVNAWIDGIYTTIDNEGNLFQFTRNNFEVIDELELDTHIYGIKIFNNGLKKIISKRIKAEKKLKKIMKTRENSL